MYTQYQFCLVPALPSRPEAMLDIQQELNRFFSYVDLIAHSCIPSTQNSVGMQQVLKLLIWLNCSRARACVCVCVCVCMCVCAKSLLTLCNPMDCMQPTRLLCPWDSPGKNTGVSCHALLQGIFLTQGLNPRLSVSCIGKCVLYHLNHLGSLLIIHNYTQIPSPAHSRQYLLEKSVFE